MVAGLPLDLMGLPAVPPGEPFPPLHPPFPRVAPSLPPNTGRLSVASLGDALRYVKPWWAFSFVIIAPPPHLFVVKPIDDSHQHGRTF